MRILVVEDNAELREYLERLLREEGHVPLCVATLADARAQSRQREFGAVLLDWMLPDGSGLDLLREMRAREDATPVLVLTARTDVADRVTGLDSGADDYLRKPFAADELRARVRALLRRGPRFDSELLRSGELALEPARRRAFCAGKELVLTAREFDILEQLLRGNGRIVTRSSLLLALWGGEDPRAEASLEVLIARLRRKLGVANCAELIRTHRGMGYSVRPDA
ncbi:MAG: response regulator transcription factor [Acidobacteria bacterium]|nr:response regulator transcription factor [Acidobacteriota bacterium]